MKLYQVIALLLSVSVTDMHAGANAMPLELTDQYDEDFNFAEVPACDRVTKKRVCSQIGMCRWNKRE